jgi:hypothetical protein
MDWAMRVRYPKAALPIALMAGVGCWLVASDSVLASPSAGLSNRIPELAVTSTWPAVAVPSAYDVAAMAPVSDSVAAKSQALGFWGLSSGSRHAQEAEPACRFIGVCFSRTDPVPAPLWLLLSVVLGFLGLGTSSRSGRAEARRRSREPNGPAPRAGRSGWRRLVPPGRGQKEGQYLARRRAAAVMEADRNPSHA